MCSVVGHMMGMELVEFPSATNRRGVLSMVIACVGRTMGKELCSYVVLGWETCLFHIFVDILLCIAHPICVCVAMIDYFVIREQMM